ncbi:hypothetical protein [Frankia sp. Mgl5]|uniref:hypothetical protein n=1 Tax=Frankia sp. Mgl5 TaxID=2933793 RepID=UPI0034D57D1B
MIGDDWAADVAGGQAAGPRTKWQQARCRADLWPPLGPCQTSGLARLLLPSGNSLDRSRSELGV